MDAKTELLYKFKTHGISNRDFKSGVIIEREDLNKLCEEYSNLRLIEVLEGLFVDKSKGQENYHDAIEDKLSELKSKPIVIEPDDVPDSVGGGFKK